MLHGNEAPLANAGIPHQFIQEPNQLIQQPVAPMLDINRLPECAGAPNLAPPPFLVPACAGNGRDRRRRNPPIPLVVGGHLDDEGSITTVSAASSTVHRYVYEPWEEFPPMPVDKWNRIAETVEEVFGPCPNPSPKGKSFRRRGGGSNDAKKIFYCNCEFFVQAYLADGYIKFGKRVGVDFPHDKASSVVKDPITDEPPIGELLKEATSGILAEHPKIQPLALWTMIRRLHPGTPNTIELFYIVQTYVKYLRSVNSLHPAGMVVTDYNSQVVYVQEHSIWDKITVHDRVGCSNAATITDLIDILGIHDKEEAMMVPLSPEAHGLINSIDLDENMKIRCKGTMLAVNAGSLWTLKMFLSLPPQLRITTLDFTLGMLSDGSSLGQVCAVGFQKDHRDKALQRQQSHPMITSLAFETKCQVALMYIAMGELSRKIFGKEFDSAYQISDLSMAIRSGRSMITPTVVLYACLIHHRNMPNNSPHWRKLIKRYPSFVQILHMFIEQMVCHYRTPKVRRRVFHLFESSCRDIAGLNQVPFMDMFAKMYGPSNVLFNVMSYYAVHIAGVASENQGHESLYRKTKGSVVVGQVPIGHMNSSLNDCLVHTLPPLLCHDLSRVCNRKSLLLNELTIGANVGVQEMVMCKLTLTMPDKDVREISQKDLLVLCPQFAVAVGILPSAITCYVCNSAATAGKAITDARVKRMSSILFENHFDLPTNEVTTYKNAGSFYEMAMQDLMFVFSTSENTNPHLLKKMAHNYLSLYCWTCYTFQRSCYCDHTITVASLQGTLTVAIEELMTNVFARNTGRSHRRMNPTYTRARNVHVNDMFHVNYGVSVGDSKRLDYLVDRSKDVLRQLIGKMYRKSDLHLNPMRNGYYRETNRLSKQTLLDIIIIGTSLGEYIKTIQLAAGTRQTSDFIERHERKKNESFPAIVGMEAGPEPVEYYPPIFDMQYIGSCLGYEMQLESDRFGEIQTDPFGLNYQIAVAFWFALLGEYKDISINSRIDIVDIPGLFAPQTVSISGHIAQIGTCIKQSMDNDGSTANDMIKRVDLGFRANTPLQNCLPKVRLLRELAEHNEVDGKIVSLIYITPNGCHTVFRMKTPGNVFEYRLVNLSEKKRLVCKDIYALFRLLHRVYMYEMNSPENNPEGNRRNNGGLRNRSILFRICGNSRTLVLTDNYMEGVGEQIGLPGIDDEFDEPETDDPEETDDEDSDDEDEEGESEESEDNDSESEDDDDDMPDQGVDQGVDADAMINEPMVTTEEEISTDNDNGTTMQESSDDSDPIHPFDGMATQPEDNNGRGRGNAIVGAQDTSTTRVNVDNTTNSGDTITDRTNESSLRRDPNNANQQEDQNNANQQEDVAIVFELSEDEEVYEPIPDSTKQEWLEMQELQRQEDRKAKLEAEQRLAAITLMNRGRRITRQSSSTTEILHCQLCNLAGDHTYAEYINGVEGGADCSMNHPLCNNCIFGLWKTPNAYSVGDDLLRGQRIRFTRGIIRCPLCSMEAVYVSRKSGEPIKYNGKSIIHGVIEWKNHFNMNDTLHHYVAGTGMDDVWDGITNLFLMNEKHRPRARKLIETELIKMFGDRTFNCNVCKVNKSMMDRFAHTNGIRNVVGGRVIMCTFKVCKECLKGDTMRYQKTNGRILFRCPSCEAAKIASHPNFQEAGVWFGVRFLSTESDRRYGGPRDLMRVD